MTMRYERLELSFKTLASTPSISLDPIGSTD
jgi:hypothetical protein